MPQQQPVWQCLTCGRTFAADFEIEWSLQCPSCQQGPLELTARFHGQWQSATLDLPGIWRYLPLLPVGRIYAERLFSDDEPQVLRPVLAPALADRLGIKSLALLPCTAGPSGTFKDAEAAVVIAKWLEWGAPTRAVSWHSTGNTARAYRAYAIRANLESYSFFPLSCLNKWNGEARDARNSLIAYDGPFQEIADVARTYAKQRGATHLAPLHWKIQGKAALAYPVAEHLPTTTCIAQTIAGGYGAIGLHLGYSRLLSWGVANVSAPRFELFQIEGADTIAKLLPLGRDITATDLRLPVNPFEPTLQSTNPLSTFGSIRQIVSSTGSAVTSVSVSEVETEADSLATQCADLGIDISYADEKSPFISWAGLVNRSRRGRLKPSDEMVMIVTGTPERLGGPPEPDEVLKPATHQ